MNAIDPNPRAVIGANNPPEPTPYEKCAQEISDLYDEAKLWLDGKAVDSQELADGLANLLNMIREAEKRADAARTDEKRPLDEKIAEIQARYNTLIGNTKAVKGKTVLAAEACKKALAPWLEKQEAEKRAAAEKARQEAEEKARAAAEAHRKAQEATDLAAAEEAEKLIADAKKAERIAGKAEKSHATASGGIGKAVSLRTVPVVKLTDPSAAIKHYWPKDYPEFQALLIRLAERDARAGARSIPGYEISEEKRAV